MPELPEAEVVRHGVWETAGGGTITRVAIHDARSLRPETGDLAARLEGARLVGAVRRGKFLWFPLDDGPHALSIHLGMSGQVLARDPDAPPERSLRATIDVRRQGRDLQLRFVDQRLFGDLGVVPLVHTPDGGYGGHAGAGWPNPEAVAPQLASEPWWARRIPAHARHIARDALDPDADLDAVAELIRTRSAGVKSLLLQQTILAGIGNIYADEALWRARIHPETPGRRMTGPGARRLLRAVRETMLAAVAQGGTSFDEQYKRVNGESGYFAVSLNAYGRTGQPCPRCGTPIRRSPFANRSSHYCPRCQRRR